MLQASSCYSNPFRLPRLRRQHDRNQLPPYGSRGHHVGIDGHALLPVPVHLRQQAIVAVGIAGPRREPLPVLCCITLQPKMPTATAPTSIQFFAIFTIGVCTGTP